MKQFDAIHIVLNQDELYKKLVHAGAMQAGDVTICTKQAGTVGGHPIAVLQFNASVDGKEVFSVQATVTVRNLISVLRVLDTAYPDIPPGYAIVSPPTEGN